MELGPVDTRTMFMPEIGPRGPITRGKHPASLAEPIILPDRPAELAVVQDSTEILAAMQDEIKASGPMTHSRFMELSLNGPGGYYSAGRAKINGNVNDFTTSTGRSEFGGKLCENYYMMWRAMGQPAVFTVIEQGAGMGKMAKDTLAHARNVRPEMYEALKYRIVDFAGMHPRQYDTIAGHVDGGSHDEKPTYAQISTPKEHAADLSRVLWVPGSAIDTELGPLEDTVIGSNELPDTFKSDIVCRDPQDGELKQSYIDIDKSGNLTEIWGPVTDDVRQYMQTYNIQLADGQMKAITPDAVNWQRHIVSQFTPNAKGGIVTVDYGTDVAHTSYAQNVVRYFPKPPVPPYTWHLERPGEIDITTDVDFNVLQRVAREQGWDIALYGDQQDFLTLVDPEKRARGTTNYKDSLDRVRTGKRFQGFRALVLTKNIELDFSIPSTKPSELAVQHSGYEDTIPGKIQRVINTLGD